MTNIVIVSCKRDLNQLLLQLHSIERFVKVPVTVFLFIEDDFELTVKFNIDIKIIKVELDENLNGWYRQQILKLKAVEYVNDDYILLDSKNFFIKDSTLNYSFPEGNCYLLEDANWAKPFVDMLSIEDKTLSHYYTQHTPFKIRKSIATKILQTFDLPRLYSECAEKRIYPSEFTLYALTTDIKPTYKSWNYPAIYHTWWYSDDLNPDKFEYIYNSTVEILGIHKNVWYHKNDNLSKLAEWLISKGLDKEYVYPATVDMDWGKTYLQDRSPTL